MQRDFTFVEDIAEATVRCLDKVPAGNQDFSTDAPDPSTSQVPYRICNVSNHQPVELMTFIKTIEEALGKKAIMNFLPLQPGDLITTFADIVRFKNDIGFEPSTSIEKGISDWVSW
jgi:UDP-glucuronate 4-epimerase